MSKKRTYHFETRAIHEGLKDAPWQGATLPPIFQTAAHYHESADSLSKTFAGQTQDHIYMRLSNPTSRFLEQKLASLESGAGAVVTGSGMAAINNACMTLLRSGDEFVASKTLFMSSYTLFTTIFKKYGIIVKLVDPLNLDDIEQAVNEKTRFVYMETITNPGMEIADISSIADIAHAKSVPLLIDNTLASPWLCRPIELGADIVLHSTTKYLSGHGAALGGVVVDAGKFNWDQEKFSDFAPFVAQKGNLAFLHKLFKEYHVNFGTTPAPFHSFLTAIGLNTLGLRMERHMKNAITIADFLKKQPKVEWVNFPGFEDHNCHEIAKTQFCGKGFGAVLTFGLKDQDACFRFIDHLEMILNLANLGDCKTLIIHPYSSQYISFPPDLKNQLADPQLLRFSLGVEHAEDICNDLAQALKAV
ncbi:MAG: aminotransferase class I/II-fold pyridoxal phosphate-dependent enzyme [Proteobacteria bacterium]|nr:aminotransferase class I/II-fold pyridoxal phosphate-dependent enzyme [Pseudomonadota bacterium]MBU1586042.1 aminotransferase class I/II-fold pyridoxal phosphate-dependent enzyme [Pseudomonadota bacterium]MBU2453683.1 aminotransferase class I/II-fold pyridoxal phosphate-dependent enzyme [Pseudomonadota bacterium]MBU2629740.1 aminotransferase class I/II-fold pyridoxal phosphate-dependent enzyme [Pseudomonadota bacterium]